MLDKIAYPDGTLGSPFAPKSCTHVAMNATTASQTLLSEANVKKAVTVVIWNTSDTIVWLENDDTDAVAAAGMPVPPASGNNYGCLVLSRWTGTLAPKKLTVIHGGSGNKALKVTYWQHS